VKKIFVVLPPSKSNDTNGKSNRDTKGLALKKIFRNGIPLLVITCLLFTLIIALGEFGIGLFLILAILITLIFFVRRNQNVKNFVGASMLILGIIILVISIMQYQSVQGYDPLTTGFSGYRYVNAN
jgi:hypothetical protein